MSAVIWILQILVPLLELMYCSSVPGDPQSSIFNYDSNTSIIHSSIKSLDLQDGHWIECQCKHTKHLIMRRPFEHGNFTTHLLTHALAPSSQMSIRSFFQLPSACSSQRPPLRATEAIRHRVALLQQPLYTTPSPCIGSLFCQLMHTSSTNSSCCQSMEGEHAWVSWAWPCGHRDALPTA